MDYDQFDAEYQRVVEAAQSDLSTEALRVEVQRLRQLSAQVEDPDDREEAGHAVAMLENVLSTDPGPPPSEAVLAANQAYADATSSDGTPAERIARAEAGITEIARIARTADPEEESSILQFNESLHMLIGALENAD
ncbi:hypothetical protein ACFPJ1_35335 [Kribbella qitaiheensis]|uniref:hypothetical protein n=1 Tax=Kribbella qitaiheensis TaxID=1544730 RepID=UPI00360B006F